MSGFELYFNFMENYTEFYREVEKSEYEKMDALMSDDLPRLRQAMQNYEICIKKAQQIESERIELCRKLGFENMAFSEVVRHFKGEEKERLISQKNTLETILKTIQYLNKKSLEFASMQRELTEGGTATYNSLGKTDTHLGTAGILNKQI